MNSETEKRKSFETMDSHHVIASLRKTEVFSCIPYDFFFQNVHLLDEQLFAEGTPIFHKNDMGDSLFVILSGSVSIHDDDYTVAALKEGEIFGEMAFLDPGPRSMSVTALEETRLVHVRRELLREIFISYPQVEQYIIALVVKRLRQQNLRSMQHGKPQDTFLKQVREQLRELTSAELNTLRLVAEENSTRRIAELLFVTPKSVENYRCRICSKLGLDGSANSLLRFAIHHKEIILTA